MIHTFNKRLLFLLLLSCASCVMAQTDLYNRYSGRTDVRVASVTNFTLDTGITADVTLLEAIDDQSWQWLCSTFGLATPTKEQEQQIAEGWDVTMFTQRSRQRFMPPIQNGLPSITQASLTRYLAEKLSDPSTT